MTSNLSIELVDISSVKKKLNITVQPDVVRDEVKSAYKTLRSTAAVAGFRKGAVPVNILKARYHDQVLQDVSQRLIENTYAHALNEKKLVPVENPQIEVLEGKLDDGNFSYTAIFEVNPHIEIDGYKGMELKPEPVTITDEDIEEGLKSLREGRAEYKDVERAANTGDLVIVDFDGTLDGKSVKNGSARDYLVVIGERSLLPGFDTALIGAVKDETREAPLTIPETFAEKDLAGKTVRFKITVKSVKEKTVPALDDEFAADMDCANVEALKKKVSDELYKAKESQGKEKLKISILDALIEKHPFDVPEALIKKYQRILLSTVVDNMRKGIIAPEDKDSSPDQLRDKYLLMAVRQVKEDAILDCISFNEKIEVSEQELETAIRHLAEVRQTSYENLMGRIEREGALEVIKDGLKHEKAFDIIIGSARV